VVASLSDALSLRLANAMGGMSLAQLARETGLNRQQVFRYVNGQAIPRADSYMKLCRALDLDPWEVLTETKESDKPVPAKEGVFGNAKDPSPEQFPPGIYELNSTHSIELETLTRIILVVHYDGSKCVVRSILPSEILPQGPLQEFRRSFGVVKVKFQQSYYITLQSNRMSGSDESMLVTLLLGAEEPGSTLRKGVTIRSVPNTITEPLASKVCLRRLTNKGYREALRWPALFSVRDASDEVKSYFLANSASSYHMGPSFDHAVNTQNEKKAAGTHLTHGVTQAIGGGRPPSETELGSGLYEIYMPFSLDQRSLMRIPVLIGGTKESSRWIYSRMPKKYFPPDVPRVVRELTGVVLLKFSSILHIFGVVDRGDNLDKQSYYFRFATSDFRTGNRLGIGLFPDRDTQAPMAFRAVMVKSAQPTLAHAFRNSETLTVDGAPQSVRTYFTKDEFAPYILTTGAHPLFF